MNLYEAREILRQTPCFGNPVQLRAKQFIERAYEGANQVMRLVEDEPDADLVKSILWLIQKRWNEQRENESQMVLLEPEAGIRR